MRIIESPDDDAFYQATNALARSLDPTRPTGGVRTFLESHFLEDVFTLNDDDVAEAIEDDIPEELEDDAREAAENCPVSAITLE